MKKPEKMIVYNIFPLLAGPVTQWESHLQRAANMGFNWIFVNPIQRPGRSGSLYSIADYFNFNPLVIDEKSPKSAEDQVKSMIQTAEQFGLKIMIDLVINHCAEDSALIKAHPDWFAWENGGIVHPFCEENGHRVVWQDLAKFNHQHTRDREGLFQFFFKVIKFLADLGFRGFRCDAAYQLPRDLWERLIRETRRLYPDVSFFAETLGCTADETRRTSEAGFDYIFNSSKWWDLHSPWLIEQYNLTREIAYSISFPESHDTPRLAEEFGGNINILKQRYLFAAVFSAGVMIPMGYEFGFRKSLHVVNTRPTDWEKTDIDLTDFITKINAIKSKYVILQEESPLGILPSNNHNILVMWKGSTLTNEEVLVILNRDAGSKQNFYADDLRRFVQAGAPLTDVSPEYPVEFIPKPFTYDLNPGQGLIMVTHRDIVKD